MQNPSKQHTPLGLVTAADHFRIRHKPALTNLCRNPLLIAATAVVGLIAIPTAEPKWVMVK
jgi:hypothetical protein